MGDSETKKDKMRRELFSPFPYLRFAEVNHGRRLSSRLDRLWLVAPQ
jgi:hypothetical protein